MNTTRVQKIKQLENEFAKTFKKELQAMTPSERARVSCEARAQFKRLALYEAERCANMGSDAHVGYRKHIAKLINGTQGN